MIALDGTPNKANWARTRSSAFPWPSRRPPPNPSGSRSSSTSAGPNAKVLPVPMMNIINGGAHSDAPIDFQEFMIMPKGAPSFPEALRYGAEIFHALKKVLHDRGLSHRDRRRRRFRAQSESADDALAVIAQAVEKAGYKLGEADLHRARCRRHRSSTTRSKSTTSSRRATTRSGPQKRSWITTLGSARSSRSSRSRTAARRTIGTGWKKLTDRIGDKVATGGR